MTEATQRRRIPTTSTASQQSDVSSQLPTDFSSTMSRKKRRRETFSPMIVVGLMLFVGSGCVFFGLRLFGFVNTSSTEGTKITKEIAHSKPISISESTNDQQQITSTASVSLPITPFSGHTFRRAPTDAQVLAMIYPPGLMGGYRNQVIRFLSFCVYAIKHKMDSLLISSIMWSTQIHFENTGKEEWTPIPMDLLFDIDYWNTFEGQLPTLVDNDGSYPCWSTLKTKPRASKLTNQVLQRGFFKPIANRSAAIASREEITNLRWLDLVRDVDHCDRPHVYGGGTGAGRLWNDYIKMQSADGVPYNAHPLVLKALQPKKEWRDLAMSCVAKNTHNSKAYVALHARMELEMMDHKCGKRMERNLTKLFYEVEDLIKSDFKDAQIRGVFVAVSRSGIEITEGPRYQKFKPYADENLATLNRVVGTNDGSPGVGMADGRVAVFECGKHLMDKYYANNPDSIDYGDILQSIINFHIAVESTAFVGTRGSSYSTDIWTTRFHLGKGNHNYEYTKEGIKLMGNGGLPPPHKNC